MKRWERAQRKREKGWRKPPGGMCVDRSSRWGNAWRVERWGDQWRVVDSQDEVFHVGTKEGCAAEAVWLYKDGLKDALAADPDHLAPLKDATHLLCFCPVDAPHCHVTALQEMLAETYPKLAKHPANEYAPEGEPPICIWRQGEQYIRYAHHRACMKEAGEMIEALQRARDLAMIEAEEAADLLTEMRVEVARLRAQLNQPATPSPPLPFALAGEQLSWHCACTTAPRCDGNGRCVQCGGIIQ